MPFAVAFLDHEKAFLEEAGRHFALLPERTAQLLEVYPPDRPARAHSLLAETERRLWKLYGVPEDDAQTLGDHCGRMMHLAFAYPYGDPREVRELIAAFRLTQAVTGEILPCEISDEKRNLLEDLAMRIIFDAPGESHEALLLTDYRDPVTEEAQWVRDLDKIATAARALEYKARYPQLAGAMEEIAGDAADGLLTDRGREVFAEAVRGIKKIAPRPAHENSLYSHHDQGVRHCRRFG